MIEADALHRHTQLTLELEKRKVENQGLLEDMWAWLLPYTDQGSQQIGENVHELQQHLTLYQPSKSKLGHSLTSASKSCLNLSLGGKFSPKTTQEREFWETQFQLSQADKNKFHHTGQAIRMAWTLEYWEQGCEKCLTSGGILDILTILDPFAFWAGVVSSEGKLACVEWKGNVHHSHLQSLGQRCKCTCYMSKYLKTPNEDTTYHLKYIPSLYLNRPS